MKQFFNINIIESLSHSSGYVKAIIIEEKFVDILKNSRYDIRSYYNGESYSWYWADTENEYTTIGN